VPITYLSDDDSVAPGCCRVELTLPADAGAAQAWLAGEFNDWSLDATPMLARADGALSAVVVLERGRSYRYRFYLGDGRWDNDWAADGYVDNDFGGADSMVEVPSAAGTPKKRATAKKAPAKKKAATVKKVAAKKTPS
jgi:1,4-alpha-glucan branching enzyme